MIKIYNANDKTYLSNGNIAIMPLKCIETKNEGFDGWEVEVEVLPEYKDYIAQDNIIVVPTKSRGEQPFRIQNPEINTRVIKFKGNHVSFDSEKYLIQDIYPQRLNGSALLDWINTRTDRTSPFTVISDISNLGTARIIRKTLREAFLIAQEQVGGFFDFDKWQIELLSSIGLDRGETIRYGKNLQGIRVYENWSNVCTKILSVGPDGITLPEIYLMSDVQYQEVYAKTETFEINQVEGQEFTNDQLIVELRRLANEYLNNHKYPEIHYEIQADVDQTLDIGDTVYTVTKQIEVPTRVQGYVYDVNKKRVTKLVYGNFDRNIKRIFNAIKTDIEHAIEIGVSANKLVADQTNLINQLGKLGHVYQDDNEILVLDALPKEDAQNILKINLGGIGFSHTGIEGPFTTAWTIDGNFNASFITTGILNASLIKAGKIQSPDGQSYWNLDSGEIALNVKTLKITSLDVATKEDVEISVGDKSTNEDLNALANLVGDMAGNIIGKAEAGELEALTLAYNQRLQQDIIDKAKVAGDLSTLEGRIAAVDLILGEKSAKWTFIETSITMAEEGIFIGNYAKQMGVLVADDRISFIDKGVEVAYISNKTMEITHGIFVESAVIGKHKIETIAGTDITVFVYVG